MRGPWKASSLLGRLETLGPGGTAALRRRKQASQLERRWLAYEDWNNVLGLWCMLMLLGTWLASRENLTFSPLHLITFKFLLACLSSGKFLGQSVD